MVKVKIQISEAITVESSGESMQDALKGIGAIFDAQLKLKKAGEKLSDWTFQFRNPKNLEFYSMVSLDGTKELPFGTTKDGDRLFPKDVGPSYGSGGGGGGGGGGSEWDD